MINRRIKSAICDSLNFFPVVAIIGPRQVGKTTLAKEIISESTKQTVCLDLERQSDLYKLNDPELFLSQQTERLVIIDEVQNKKELYPLDFTEIPQTISQNDLWIKGGFPNVLFAKNDDLAHRWMENFINTYLHRDLIQSGLNASPKTIRNLRSMMALLNGQLFNASTLANSLAITAPTVKRYIDFLEEAFLLKSLPSYSWNMSKRLVKSPKMYLTDTGIFHH